MGIIQQALNQTLGTVAIGTRLNPNFERKQAEYKAKGELDLLEKQADTEMGVEDYLEKKVGALENIAKINPSEKNVNTFISGLDELSKEKQKMYEANKKAAELQEQKRLQKEQQKKYAEFVQAFTEGGKYK